MSADLTKEQIEELRADLIWGRVVAGADIQALCDMALRARAVEPEEVREAIEQLRMMAQGGYFKLAKIADMLDRLAAAGGPR